MECLRRSFPTELEAIAAAERETVFHTGAAWPTFRCPTCGQWHIAQHRGGRGARERRRLARHGAGESPV